MDKRNKYRIIYQNQNIRSDLKMTEIPYWIVNHYLDMNNNKENFNKFKENLSGAQEAVGGKTEFLLESNKIGKEKHKSNKREKDYYVKVRPYLIHEFNGEKTEFGVYTQWKFDNENSNFAKFINEIKKLGYRIEILKSTGKWDVVNEYTEEYMDIEYENLSCNECINQITSYINNKGFIYSKKDLSNFYLSLKSKPFVILAGVSGTGKSRLVKLFAEAIGAKCKSIPVKPDWNDSTELLGYKNIKDEFVAGELYKVIEEASNDKENKPYFICLDEMNLARVEYYLSEYLSVIESREFKDGNIVTDELFSESYFENLKATNIRIPDNLYIVGTVNMDDTTFSFSRKVLDRANTIEFSKVDLALPSLNKNNEDIEAIPLDNTALRSSFLTLQRAMEADYDFVKRINAEIIKIYNILEPHSKQFAYRVRDEIIFYMLENKQADLLKEEEAFDYQIMQKLLPTIIGSDICLNEILIALLNLSLDEKDRLNPDDYKESDLIRIAKKAREKIKKGNKDNERESTTEDQEVNKDEINIIYPRSAEKIISMLRGYKDGFVSYWQ